MSDWDHFEDQDLFPEDRVSLVSPTGKPTLLSNGRRAASVAGRVRCDGSVGGAGDSGGRGE
jgi:hypothetical protein